MRRGPHAETPWPNVDLGETADAALLRRLVTLGAAIPKVMGRRSDLRRADLYCARNLDMLALAVTARMISGGRAPIVYECLDVHRLMPRMNVVGAALRALERLLLRQTKAIIVSSPAFVEQYFDAHHRGSFRALVVENRLPAHHDYGPRPVTGPSPARGRPLRIGWFGNLRCRRSLALLLAVADRLGDRIDILMHGSPARTEIPDFDAQIAGRANVTFGGRFAWPDDLPRIYGDIDLIWAGDFHDPGANSAWLLPNRYYEGGYYGVPSLAPSASEAGRRVAALGFGYTLDEPLEETLPQLLSALDAEDLARVQARVREAPDHLFVQSPTELKDLLAQLLTREPQDATATRRDGTTEPVR
jgi:succinoglycan biosynthesis protein ExoL